MEVVVIPCALDLERWLLRCFLSGDLECFEFDADVFHDAAHRTLFEAVVLLSERRSIVAQASVVAHLRSTHQYEAIGGDALFNAIAAEHRPSDELDWRRTLTDCALARKLIRAAQGIAAPDGSYKEKTRHLAAAAAVLERIIHRDESPEPLHVTDAVISAFEHITQVAETKKSPPGLTFGHAGLNDLTAGMRPGDLVIVAGRPGTGKTSLALDIAVSAATELSGNGHVLVFSLEVPTVSLANRLLMAAAEVDTQKLRTGRLEHEDLTKLTRAAELIDRLPIYIRDPARVTIEQLRTQALRQLAHGLAFLIVDYVQLIRPRRYGDTREREMTEVSRRLKQLARELNVPVLITSQMNRRPDRREPAQPRPILSDLRDSGALEEDADLVLFLHPEDGANAETRSEVVEIIVAKQRRGPTGSVRLKFRRDCGRFEELPIETPPEPAADAPSQATRRRRKSRA